MTVLRALVILGIAATLGLTVTLPAFAGMTKCLCNNGKVINSSRRGERGCNSACKILGGGGRVWTPDDQLLEGDSTVVAPRRRGGPARPRR
jgi:hypothetical protein